MQDKIKRAVRKLNGCYVVFWLIPIFLFAAGEAELLPVGDIADNEGATYLLETISILLTIACVPTSLKLFSWVLKKKIDNLSIEQALACYVRWSIIRLGLLEVGVVVGVVCYYLTMSSAGGLCALIGLVASLFCLPSDKRLRSELHIN